MSLSIYGYMYGVKVDRGRKHASVLQDTSEIRLKNYAATHFPKETLSESNVQNYCSLPRTQTVNLVILFQLLKALSILETFGRKIIN